MSDSPRTDSSMLNMLRMISQVETLLEIYQRRWHDYRKTSARGDQQSCVLGVFV